MQKYERCKEVSRSDLRVGGSECHSRRALRCVTILFDRIGICDNGAGFTCVRAVEGQRAARQRTQSEGAQCDHVGDQVDLRYYGALRDKRPRHRLPDRHIRLGDERHLLAPARSCARLLERRNVRARLVVTRMTRRNARGSCVRTRRRARMLHGGARRSYVAHKEVVGRRGHARALVFIA